MPGRNVELQWRKNSEISINADPDLMLQVLMNLLKNSINATPLGIARQTLLNKLKEYGIE